MQFTISHRIAIAIGDGAARAVQHLLLTPRSFQGQTVRAWQVTGDGIETAARFTDAYGNAAILCNQVKPATELVFVAEGVVETIDRSGVAGRLPGDPVPALFTRITPATQPDETLIGGLDSGTRDRIALFHALMARVGDGTMVQAQDGQEQAQAAPAADAAELTHRYIGALRGLGIPARFVTGYLAGEEGEDARFHVWAEAYDERLGWIGFDCALQLCPTERHVRLAVGLDAASTAPVRSAPAESVAPHSLSVAAAQ